MTQHPIVQKFPRKEMNDELLKQYVIKNVVGKNLQQCHLYNKNWYDKNWYDKNFYDKNVNLTYNTIMLKPPKKNETIKEWIKRNYIMHIP